MPFKVLQPFNLNLIIKVTNVTNNGTVMHGAHVVNRNDIKVSCRCDEDIPTRSGIFHGDNFKPLHGGL